MQFIRLVVAFVVTAFVARILGPEGYGIASSIFVFSSVFSFILDPGFARSLIRYVSVYHGSGRDYYPLLAGYLFYKVFIGSLLALVFYLLAPYFAQLVNASNHIFAFQLYALCIFFNSLSSVFMTYLNGVNRIDLAVLYNTVGFIIGEASSLALVLMGFGVIGYVTGFITMSIVVFIIYILKHGGLLIRLVRIPIGNALSGLRIIIPLSLSILATQITYYVYTWLDKFIVLGILGTYGLGIYMVALRFAGIFENVRSSLGSALMPYYGVVFGANGLDALRGRVFRVSRLLSATFMPLLMFLASLSMILIPLIYGDAFANAWGVASAHILYLALMSFVVGYGGIPVILEARKELILSSIITSLGSLGLELSLVYVGLGSLGVVVGRDLAQVLGFMYMYSVLYAKLNLRFDFRSWLRGLLVGFLLFITSLLIVMNTPVLWLLSPMVALLMYVSLAGKLKLICKEDIVLLRSSIPSRFSRIIDLVEEVLT